MFTIYILIAVPLYEEPDLIKQLGPEYIEYMKTTPAYIPSIPYLTKKKTIWYVIVLCVCGYCIHA